MPIVQNCIAACKGRGTIAAIDHGRNSLLFICSICFIWRNFMRKLTVLAMAMALTACATQDPYTGQQKPSNAAKGAGIGAIAGAVLGAATASKHDRDKGILTGALAGAAIGGGTGAYMDRQEKQIRDRLVGSGVQVSRDGNNIQLIMPGNITFATGRSEIRSDFYSVLNSVTEVLAEFKNTRIKVSGHTDNTGGADMNQRLSEDRAASVKDYLIGRGVASGRVNSIGYSYRYPIATNSTPAGREANRRVELELEPTE
jgi:outer membrane protein OmpA-like peptidoglycan-associated protein